MPFTKRIQLLLLVLVLLLPFSTSVQKLPETMLIQSREAYWLAVNIYHEAGNQSKTGKMAVGIVTLNRVNHPSLFGDTVERVVKEPRQFSWYNNKVVPKPKNQKAWQESLYVAHLLLTNPNKLAIIDKLRDATHYHATYVKPKWSESLVRVAQIGDHVFYRMKH
jgi:N-acetylmuramoyl-L-alanine amidase